VSKFTVEGKRVVVTGAGSGIGRQVALGFAEAGAHVACVDMNLAGARETAQSAAGSGHKAIALEANVSDPASVTAMVEEVVHALGRIDVLENSAGINIQGDAESFDFETWKRVLEVNLFGTFLVDQAVGKQMIRQGDGGSIINISSFCSTHIVKTDHQSAYYASKGGVLMLTKALAVEWTRYGIRVNCIAPGFTATPMFQADREKNNDAELLLQQVPMNRFQDPKEMTGVSIFLASDASSYVTGHELASDGGRNCL
jgi:NAD(P)-dependent dehydrogenase (short-subunit alcohol dehydrogenase family)